MSNSGSLLQLVATGRQDIYLSGNPQTTFFKQVYRRYTNFSVETQRIPFDTAVDFGKLITTSIPRSGDLLSQMFLEIKLPEMTPNGPVLTTGAGVVTEPETNYAEIVESVSWVNGIGYAMIDYISIWIGQQEVDRQYGEFMYLWTQLSTPGSKKVGVDYMTGTQEVYNDTTQKGPLKLYVPLQFWFCKNVGLALPLVALQASPIKIYIRLKNGNDLVFGNTLENAVLNNTPLPCPLTPRQPTITDMTLWGDFIYLDVEERRRFVSSKHEYLIEQTQQQKRFSVPEKTTITNIPLTFNHPMKEMIWVVNQDRMVAAHEWFNYGSRMLNEYGIPNMDLISTCLIQFDGYDRFEEMSAEYFRLIQPWQRHTAIPNDFIYVYSFSLAPEASQPQGTCNASRIDSIVLQLKMNTSVQTRAAGVTVYATNYNVLRIASGLGGVLFTV
jgi:hypothetical protein